MPRFVYVGAAGAPATGSGPQMQGTYRLDVDTGQWRRLAGGLPADVEVRSIVSQPGSPNIVYAGAQTGVYRSTDAGDTWTPLPLPGKERVVWSILIHPKDTKTIYVGTEGTTIYRSTDGGASFSELDVPIPRGAVTMNFPTRVLRLAVDPNATNEIYAALEVAGMVRSLDGGKTWEDCNANLLAFTKEARYKSRIGSDTDTEGMMDSHALAVSPGRKGTVFLANRMGLFQSSDRASTWSDMDVGRFSPLTYARDVQVAPHDPRTMYAALSVAAVSDAGSLYRSQDFGENWSRFDHGVSIDSTLMTIAPSHSNPQRVYCAARRGQVFGTEDGGKSWQSYRLPDGAQGIYSLALN
jgi:photosystem II stability/assembly factor-like uncharacterized protein